MLHIFFHPNTDKEILKIPKEFRMAILDTIAQLGPLNHPLQHRRVIKLRGRRTKDFRLRVGEYRIEFTLEEPDTLRITRVENRQAGY